MYFVSGNVFKMFDLFIKIGNVRNLLYFIVVVYFYWVYGFFFCKYKIYVNDLIFVGIGFNCLFFIKILMLWKFCLDILK